MFTVEQQGVVRVLRPQTSLAGSHCDPLRGAAIGGYGAGRPMLVIDMHETPLVDSSGLEMLIDVREQIEARGGAVKLAAVNPLCYDILRVTGVGQRFEQYELVKAAVGSFAE